MQDYVSIPQVPMDISLVLTDHFNKLDAYAEQVYSKTCSLLERIDPDDLASSVTPSDPTSRAIPGEFDMDVVIALGQAAACLRDAYRNPGEQYDDLCNPELTATEYSQDGLRRSSA
jgi:hypothetical protein